MEEWNEFEEFTEPNLLGEDSFEDEAEKERQTWQNAFSEILGSPEKRRFFYQFLLTMKVIDKDMSSVIFSPDVAQMAFEQGKRCAGLLLMNEFLKHAPDSYHKMIKENQT